MEIMFAARGWQERRQRWFRHYKPTGYKLAHLCRTVAILGLDLRYCHWSLAPVGREKGVHPGSTLSRP